MSTWAFRLPSSGTRHRGRPAWLGRHLLAALLGALLACGWHALAPVPVASAVGPGAILATYRLRLKGDGFFREGVSGAIRQSGVKGTATMTIALAEGPGDPRVLDVAIVLDQRLDATPIGKSTPSPNALKGRGILVRDSLTLIGAGQPNFVNAATLRFTKNGKRVAGWWLTSFPGSDADRGFISGAGVVLRGKRLRTKGDGTDTVVPLPAALQPR